MAAGGALSAVTSLIIDDMLDGDGRKRSLGQINPEIFFQSVPSPVEDMTLFEEIPAESQSSRFTAN